MFTTTRVSLGTTFGAAGLELSTVLSEADVSPPFTQYSRASAKSCCAFSSPTAPRIASAERCRDSSARRRISGVTCQTIPPIRCRFARAISAPRRTTATAFCSMATGCIAAEWSTRASGAAFSYCSRKSEGTDPSGGGLCKHRGLESGLALCGSKLAWCFEIVGQLVRTEKRRLTA